MLQQSSLKSPSSSSSQDPVHHEGEHDYHHPSTSDYYPPPQQQQHHHQPPPPLQQQMININLIHPSSLAINNMPRLLITCAQLLFQSHLEAAHRLNGVLAQNSSPYGDSTERLVHQFSKALSMKLMSASAVRCGGGGSSSSSSLLASSPPLSWPASLDSCYLWLNQVTPFIRFSHLTANQAILEAIEQQESVHILDFDIMHGLQWPPLMQALAERYKLSSMNHPPLYHPMLRITATGSDLTVLNRTGDRLSMFAQSLGLRFQFHPLLVLDEGQDIIASISHLLLLPNETLAVNFALYLHRLLKGGAGGGGGCGGGICGGGDDDNQQLVQRFLQRIKSLNPKIVTIAEREGNHNNPVFLQRFEESLEYYAAMFDSLEATLPPNSKERHGVEQIWLGREIMDIVAGDDGDRRRERHQRFEYWEMMLKRCGFENVALSPFALSQARLLLRLHYPSEGYQLQIRNNSFFLGWQNRPLFSVSSWR